MIICVWVEGRVKVRVGFLYVDREGVLVCVRWKGKVGRWCWCLRNRGVMCIYVDVGIDCF